MVKIFFILILVLALQQTFVLCHENSHQQGNTCPLFLWNGKKNLKKNYQKVCNFEKITKIVMRDTLKKTGHVTLLFVNEPKITTLDFMKQVGAFSETPKTNSFGNLQGFISKRESIVFPTCSCDSEELISGIKARAPVGNLEYVADKKSFLKLKEEKLLLKGERSIIVVVKLVEDKLHEKDAFIKYIVTEIEKLTGGDYNAIWTTKNSHKSHQGGRKILSVNSQSSVQSTNALTNAYHGNNDTYWVPEELYIDEHVLSGLLIWFLILIFLFIGIYATHQIETSPHITDAFNLSMKKED